MWTEKTCPQKPSREKGEEIWDGPATAYIPRQGDYEIEKTMDLN